MDINTIKNTSKEIFRNRLLYLARLMDYPLAPPEVLQVNITNRCNLGCRMCFVRRYVGTPKDEITTAQVLSLINDAYIMGIRTVVISGGEPFLREDIYDICKYCSEKDMRTVVTTNGVLLENKLLRIIDSRISHLHFSIDGLEQTHDYIRNKRGCFNKVTNMIKGITDFKYKNGKGPSISLACVVMRQNVNELPDLFKLADKLKMDLFDPLPLLLDNTDFAKLRNEDVAELCFNHNDDIDRLKKAFMEIANIKTKHVRLNPYFDLPLFVKYYQRSLRPSDWKCFAGFKTLFITRADTDKGNGKVPSIFMCKYHITGVFEKGIHSLWFSKKARDLRKKIRKCNALCFQSCFNVPRLLPLIKLTLNQQIKK